ncbi:phosphoribosylglycinamide formyltransferase [Sedimentibacter sp. zth1]|uniref:phosphoribosylglycinamide formyltransferase n=1 Tax=Sedimentibacter sp. zth1 TaxID=2816908 RepID=UPI001A9277D7|nr:phosphoribosylglycinamide formyltransferase [Sedimentibacter sp. zth1]QSX04982.1 phosphoribosylglycinamide formyltransferase [Sedimentibacter sp. zth1]
MPQLKIGVLISGGGTNLQSIIDNINNGFIDAKIDVVISNKKSAYGLERAKSNGIDAIYVNPNNYKGSEEYNQIIISELQDRNIDLIVLAGYLKILSMDFVRTFENKIINIHPSLIPSFCGRGYYGIKVHEEVIKYGVKVTGATVHFVDDGADTGPIILQDIVFVDNNDTPLSLQLKVLNIEHKILPLAIKLFCENKLVLEDRRVIIKN